MGTLAALVAFALTGPSDARAAEPFTSGTGSAKASLITPTVAAGNLAVTVLVGEANAGYRDRSAIGKSVLFDVPALRIASAISICGQAPADIGAYLPPIVVADTGVNGDKEPVDAPSSTAGVGFDQAASAQPEASSKARTGVATLPLGPLGTIKGAEAVTSTSSDAATQTRTATAKAEIGRVELLGGLIQLRGLRWDLAQTLIGPDHRADEETITGGFSLGELVVAIPGLPPLTLPILTPDQLPAVIEQANEVLGLLGVQIRLPVMSGDPAAGSHTVSPLTIAFGGSKWLLSPVVAGLANTAAFQELTRQIQGNLFDPSDCNELGGLLKSIDPQVSSFYNTLGSSMPLLIAVITGSLGGTGEVQVNLGGVETRLEDEYFAPLAFKAPSFGTPSVATPGRAGTPAVPGQAPQVAPGGSERLAAAPIRTECTTTSPAGKPGCWVGRAPLAAGIGVGFTVLVLAVDEALRRRRRGTTLEVSS
jgi:hypothetical protein